MTFFDSWSCDLSYESIMINTNFGFKPPKKSFFCYNPLTRKYVCNSRYTTLQLSEEGNIYYN